MSLLRSAVSKMAGPRLRAWATRRLRAAGRPAKIQDSPEARELNDKVAAIPFWWHSVDLGMGVVTPGLKTPTAHARELAALHLPDLRGKSVLDIGAWDGFYSFAAERLGAARVVALDHHVWGLDREAKNRYKAECRKKGIPQQHPRQIPSLWKFDELPGKRGFDLAHAALHSRVEAVVCDLMRMDSETIGQFDVVLYLGVLYHIDDPLESLRRVRRVTKGVAIIETEAIAIGGCENRPLCEFFPPGAKLSDARPISGRRTRPPSSACARGGLQERGRVDHAADAAPRTSCPLPARGSRVRVSLTRVSLLPAG